MPKLAPHTLPKKKQRGFFFFLMPFSECLFMVGNICGGKNNLKNFVVCLSLQLHTYHNFLFSFALKPAMIHTYIHVLSPSCFIIFLFLILILIFCTCLIRKVDLVKKKWRGEKKKGILHWMDFLPWLSSEIGLLANNSFYTFRRCMKLAKWVWRGGGLPCCGLPLPSHTPTFFPTRLLPLFPFLPCPPRVPQKKRLIHPDYT